ncbi:hypothetical protein E4L96_18740 [Massilia arenosa]|uniref:Uncharacterized protein n=1 Tax=Zemynaea arenosa TaxID=2561931 RepID=A0A4Y9S4U0_9BURK|nr:hypothetical protein [Massilia arenosa]TFW14875.1 hypothetical protein E4L96_18740 [Massilia arenosa]
MSYDQTTDTTPAQAALPPEPAPQPAEAPLSAAASGPAAAPRQAKHVTTVARPRRRFALRFGATAGAMKAALQWRLLVLWVALMLIPTAIAAVPFWTTLKGAFDNSVHASELAARLDAIAIADLQIAFKAQNGMITTSMILALIVTFLLSPLLSGMVATATRAPQPLRWRELVAGGLQQYPRMFYMLLWALIPMGIAMALYGIASGAAEEINDKAITPADAAGASRFAMVVFVLAVAFFHTTVEGGRAVLALDRRRVSPFKAWWDGLKLVLRQPVAAIGSWVIITAAALLIVGLLGVARLNANGAGAGAFWLAMLLTQVIALVIAWMRCARMYALVELARP